MLKELIDKYYLETEEGKGQDRFWISDAGKCQRAVFFKIKKAPKKEADARFLRLLDHGGYIHQRIMRVLFSQGIVRASEISIPATKDIGGKADAILGMDNQLYVLDIKSINSSILKTLRKPKEEHLDQILLYMHFFNIKRGILLYEGKDNQEIREFEIAYNPEKVKKLLSDFSDLKVKLEKDSIPERLLGYPNNWQCRYCQFIDICKIVGGEEIDWKKAKEKMEGKPAFPDNPEESEDFKEKLPF